MTLGPKFYEQLVSAITRRRMNENQRLLGESSQNFAQILNLLSKQDLKYYSQIDLFGFAAIAFHMFVQYMNFSIYCYICYALFSKRIYIYIYIYILVFSMQFLSSPRQKYVEHFVSHGKKVISGTTVRKILQNVLVQSCPDLLRKTSPSEPVSFALFFLQITASLLFEQIDYVLKGFI